MKPSRTITILLGVLMTYSFSFSQKAQWSLPLEIEKMWRTTKEALLPKLYERYKQLYDWNEPPKYATDDSVFTVVGRWAWGPCLAVDVKDNYAYIGNGLTFQVLDISNPSVPTIVAEYILDGLVGNIRIRDSLAFVCGGRGLVIMDISNPLQPRKLGEETIPAPKEVIPTDSFAYVTNFSSFGVVDVTDPTAPRTRSVVGVGEFPACLAVKERFAYVGTLTWPGLLIIDCRNPDSLILIEDLDIGGWGISAYLYDTLLLLGVAEYDGNQSLKLYNVAHPASPVELGRVVVGHTWNDQINSIAVDSDYAFAALSGHGIRAIEISDPTQPKIVDSLYNNFDNDNGSGSSIASVNGRLCTASNSGLWIADATRPDSLNSISFFIAGGDGPLDIALEDQYAYIAVGVAGLAVLDISNPNVPVRVVSVDLHGEAYSIAVENNYAYIVGRDALWSVDISVPQSPEVTNYSPMGGPPIDIIVKGNRGYVVQYDSGIVIFDLSNPAAPTRIGFYQVTANRIAVQDSFLYVAAGGDGLIILDVGDPQHVVEINRMLSVAVGVFVKGTLAYVATDTGLAIIDVANPESPLILSEISTPWSRQVADMGLSANFVYLSYNGALFAIDVSNPSFPTVVERYNSSFGQRIAVRDSYIYLCDHNAGLEVLHNNLILQIKSPPLVSQFSLEQNYPNPFNPQTTIEFTLPVREHVIIKMFNILGEYIRTLADGTLDAGKHRILVDASDISSGIYLYQLTTPEFSTVRKMVIVR